MKEEEDEEDNTAIGVARYPCMPSLVALQQMRNRLHLAHVGKKLMKWTAMATGREMRKIAGEMIDLYDDYDKRCAHAFMLLARCRYFYPNLNRMVVNNPPRHPREATVTVTTTQKSITGCKVLAFEILQTGNDNYEHLAIEKGGQAVADAKKAWYELLITMIQILQLRTSFELTDFAHKSASKSFISRARMMIPRMNKRHENLRTMTVANVEIQLDRDMKQKSNSYNNLLKSDSGSLSGTSGIRNNDDENLESYSKDDTISTEIGNTSFLSNEDYFVYHSLNSNATIKPAKEENDYEQTCRSTVQVTPSFVSNLTLIPTMEQESNKSKCDLNKIGNVRASVVLADNGVNASVKTGSKAKNVKIDDSMRNSDEVIKRIHIYERASEDCEVCGENAQKPSEDHANETVDKNVQIYNLLDEKHLNEIEKASHKFSTCKSCQRIRDVHFTSTNTDHSNCVICEQIFTIHAQEFPKKHCVANCNFCYDLWRTHMNDSGNHSKCTVCMYLTEMHLEESSKTSHRFDKCKLCQNLLERHLTDSENTDHAKCSTCNNIVALHRSELCRTSHRINTCQFCQNIARAHIKDTFSDHASCQICIDLATMHKKESNLESHSYATCTICQSIVEKHFYSIECCDVCQQPTTHTADCDVCLDLIRMHKREAKKPGHVCASCALCSVLLINHFRAKMKDHSMCPVCEELSMIHSKETKRCTHSVARCAFCVKFTEKYKQESEYCLECKLYHKREVLVPKKPADYLSSCRICKIMQRSNDSTPSNQIHLNESIFENKVSSKAGEKVQKAPLEDINKCIICGSPSFGNNVGASKNNNLICMFCQILDQNFTEPDHEDAVIGRSNKEELLSGKECKEQENEYEFTIKRDKFTFVRTKAREKNESADKKDKRKAIQQTADLVYGEQNRKSVDEYPNNIFVFSTAKNKGKDLPLVHQRTMVKENTVMNVQVNYGTSKCDSCCTLNESKSNKSFTSTSNLQANGNDNEKTKSSSQINTTPENESEGGTSSKTNKSCCFKKPISMIDLLQGLAAMVNEKEKEKSNKSERYKACQTVCGKPAPKPLNSFCCTNEPKKNDQQTSDDNNHILLAILDIVLKSVKNKSKDSCITETCTKHKLKSNDDENNDKCKEKSHDEKIKQESKDSCSCTFCTENRSCSSERKKIPESLSCSACANIQRHIESCKDETGTCPDCTEIAKEHSKVVKKKNHKYSKCKVCQKMALRHLQKCSTLECRICQKICEIHQKMAEISKHGMANCPMCQKLYDKHFMETCSDAHIDCQFCENVIRQHNIEASEFPCHRISTCKICQRIIGAHSKACCMDHSDCDICETVFKMHKKETKHHHHVIGCEFCNKLYLMHLQDTAEDHYDCEICISINEMHGDESKLPSHNCANCKLCRTLSKIIKDSDKKSQMGCQLCQEFPSLEADCKVCQRNKDNADKSQRSSKFELKHSTISQPVSTGGSNDYDGLCCKHSFDKKTTFQHQQREMIACRMCPQEEEKHSMNCKIRKKSSRSKKSEPCCSMNTIQSKDSTEYGSMCKLCEELDARASDSCKICEKNSQPKNQVKIDTCCSQPCKKEVTPTSSCKVCKAKLDKKPSVCSVCDKMKKESSNACPVCKDDETESKPLCATCKEKHMKSESQCKICKEKQKNSQPQCKICKAELEKSESQCKVCAEKQKKSEPQCKICKEKLEKADSQCKVCAEKQKKPEPQCKICKEHLEKSESKCKICAEKQKKPEPQCKICKEKLEKSESQCKICKEKHTKTESQCKICKEKHVKSDSNHVCHICNDKAKKPQVCHICKNIESVSKQPKEKTCSICKKKEPEPFTCSICKKNAKSESSVCAICKTTNTNTESFICSVCKKNKSAAENKNVCKICKEKEDQKKKKDKVCAICKSARDKANQPKCSICSNPLQDDSMQCLVTMPSTVSTKSLCANEKPKSSSKCDICKKNLNAKVCKTCQKAEEEKKKKKKRVDKSDSLLCQSCASVKGSPSSHSCPKCESKEKQSKPKKGYCAICNEKIKKKSCCTKKKKMACPVCEAAAKPPEPACDVCKSQSDSLPLCDNCKKALMCENCKKSLNTKPDDSCPVCGLNKAPPAPPPPPPPPPPCEHCAHMQLEAQKPAPKVCCDQEKSKPEPSLLDALVEQITEHLKLASKPSKSNECKICSEEEEKSKKSSECSVCAKKSQKSDASDCVTLQISQSQDGMIKISTITCGNDSNKTPTSKSSKTNASGCPKCGDDKNNDQEIVLVISKPKTGTPMIKIKPKGDDANSCCSSLNGNDQNKCPKEESDDECEEQILHLKPVKSCLSKKSVSSRSCCSTKTLIMKDMSTSTHNKGRYYLLPKKRASDCTNRTGMCACVSDSYVNMSPPEGCYTCFSP